jgi:hypothetical protein
MVSPAALPEFLGAAAVESAVGDLAARYPTRSTSGSTKDLSQKVSAGA